MQTQLRLSFTLAFIGRSSAIRSFVIGCLVVVWPQVFHSELVKPGGSGTLKAIGCSSLREGGGELGTLKSKPIALIILHKT